MQIKALSQSYIDEPRTTQPQALVKYKRVIEEVYGNYHETTFLDCPNQDSLESLF